MSARLSSAHMEQAVAAALALVVLFPLANLPSMRVLTRFNALGVWYIHL